MSRLYAGVTSNKKAGQELLLPALISVSWRGRCVLVDSYQLNL